MYTSIMNKSNRYSRQMILPELGEKGQRRIMNTSVLVVGCGGLGCAALPYLVSSGIGKIGIIDGDKVEMSNLQRQTLFTDSDIDKYKVNIAFERLSKQNPTIDFRVFNSFLDAETALELFPQYDIIIDATDRISMRYLISDACVLSNKPFVHASIEKWTGQLSVFNYKNGPSYRDLYPEEDSTVPNCTEVGVIGSAVGILGSMQAQEAIKITLDMPEVLSGKLLVINTKNYAQKLISFQKDKLKELGEEEFLQTYREPAKQVFSIKELDPFQAQLIDVREKEELPLINDQIVEQIPLSVLEENLRHFEKEKPYYLFCQSGMRSQKALQILSSNGFSNIFLLKEQAEELMHQFN